MKRKMDDYVLCPYYKSDERQIIYCEGVDEGTALHLAFSTLPQLKEYKVKFCRNCWGECMIAAMLNRKYDYE